MKEKKEMEKVNMCCFFLIKTMLDTNADEMTVTQNGFHDSEKVIGDFEIIVKKIK